MGNNDWQKEKTVNLKKQGVMEMKLTISNEGLNPPIKGVLQS